MPLAPSSRGRRAAHLPDAKRLFIEAAARAFAAHGFEGADLRGIAREAGLSAGLVRGRFGGKAELWAACVDQIVESAAPILERAAALTAETGRPPAERLTALIGLYAALAETLPYVRDFVTRGVADSPERAALVMERLIRPAYLAGRDLILEGIKAGLVRVETPDVFFALLSATLFQPHSLCEFMGALEPEAPPCDARRMLAEALPRLLLNLDPPPA